MKFLLPYLVTFWLFSVVSCAIDDEKLYRDLKPYLGLLAAKDALGFGESCDPAFEEVRKEQGKALLDLVSRASSFKADRFKASLTQTITAMAMISGSYCNSSRNLQCIGKGHCGCAYTEESFGSSLTLERVGDLCLISAGSICLPMESSDHEKLKDENPLLGSLQKQEFRCASAVGCIFKEDGAKCTAQAMQEAIQQMALEQGMTEISPVFRLQKAKEGLCICIGSGMVASGTLLILASWILFTFKLTP